MKNNTVHLIWCNYAELHSLKLEPNQTSKVVCWPVNEKSKPVWGVYIYTQHEA